MSKTAEKLKVEEGRIIVVNGTEYVFGSSSTDFFNQLLEKDADLVKAISVTVRRKSDRIPVPFLFTKLKSILEDG